MSLQSGRFDALLLEHIVGWEAIHQSSASRFPCAAGLLVQRTAEAANHIMRNLCGIMNDGLKWSTTRCSSPK